MTGADTQPVPGPRPPAGRELGLVIALGLVAAGGVVFAAGRPWQHLASTAITGRQLDSVPYALGLVGLAGTIAVLAAGRFLRPVVGVLVALSGVGAGLASVAARNRSVAVGSFSYSDAQPSRVPTAWPWISLTAAVLLALVGIAVLVRGNRWPGMGRRYEAPGTPTPPSQDPDRAAWQTLDEGGDPTVDAPAPAEGPDPGADIERDLPRTGKQHLSRLGPPGPAKPDRIRTCRRPAAATAGGGSPPYRLL